MFRLYSSAELPCLLIEDILTHRQVLSATVTVTAGAVWVTVTVGTPWLLLADEAADDVATEVSPSAKWTLLGIADWINSSAPVGAALSPPVTVGTELVLPEDPLSPSLTPVSLTKFDKISVTLDTLTYLAESSDPQTMILDVPTGPTMGVISWKISGRRLLESLSVVALGRARGMFIRCYRY